MLDRRQLLLAGAAACAGCTHAAAQTPDPGGGRRVSPRRRAPGAALAAHARLHAGAASIPRGSRRKGACCTRPCMPGAEADAALAEFDWGRSGAPYPVTHRNGAYRRAAEMREDRPGIAVREVSEDTGRLEGHAARGVIAPDFVHRCGHSGGGSRRPARARQRRTRAMSGSPTRWRRRPTRCARLRARAGSEPGMWRLPDGERYYALALQLQLGAPVDPREAHARALARCRELQAEADSLLRAQGLSQRRCRRAAARTGARRGATSIPTAPKARRSGRGHERAAGARAPAARRCRPDGAAERTRRCSCCRRRRRPTARRAAGRERPISSISATSARGRAGRCPASCTTN